MLGLLINVDGVNKRIDFKQTTISDSGIVGCIYTTDDKAVQKAIEANERFNSGYRNQVWTDDVEEVEPVVEQAEEPVAEVKKTRKTKAKAE